MLQGRASIIELLRNFPHCDDYREDSFTGIFHEQQEWNDSEYWKLDKAIYDLAFEYDGSEIPRNVAWPVMRIFSYLMMSIQAHHNSNDGFAIRNMDAETMQNWRERLQLVMEGFFSGRMPNNEIFEYQNPLL